VVSIMINVTGSNYSCLTTSMKIDGLSIYKGILGFVAHITSLTKSFVLSVSL
jgi:hypothetical protein